MATMSIGGGSSGSSGGGRSTTAVQRGKVRKLERQIIGQETKLSRVQGKTLALPKSLQEPKKKPSVIGRIFDVLSRGQYASAAVARGLTDKDSGSLAEEGVGAIKNLWGGLSGKKKETYANVLKDVGVKNKAALGIGGFIGDVLLDPTTYLTAGASGLAKGGAQGAKALAQAKKVSDVTTAAKDAKKIMNAYEAGQASLKAGRQAAKEAGELTKKVKGQPAYEAGKKAKREEISEQTQKVIDEEMGNAKIIESLERPRIQVKLNAPFRTKGGIHIADIPLDKPFGGASRVAQKFLETEVGGSLGKFFSTAHLYGETGQKALRSFTNSGAAGWEEKVAKDIRPLFKGSSKEARDITNAAVDPNYIAELRKLTDEHWEDLVARGMEDEANRMVDYIPQFFQEKGPEWNKFVKGRKQGIKTQKLDANGKPVIGADGKPVFEKKMKYSVEEAKAAGLKPITDIEEIMTREHGNHVAKIAHNDVTRAMLNELGTVIKDPDAAKWATRNGMVKVTPSSSRYAKVFLSGLDDADDYYMSKQAYQQLKRIDEYHTRPELAGALLRTYDKILGEMKFGMTAVNPGHHVRNIQGDIFLAMEDGVVNPQVYTQSARILKNPSKHKIKLGKGGAEISGDEALDLFGRIGGAKSGMIRQEFEQELSGRGFTGVKEKIRRVGEWREDWGRFAHFIHALKEETANLPKSTISKVGTQRYTRELEEAAKKAGQRVRKWHVDYGDLTPAERKYMKRAIPFYTFMRKNIPLQLEAIALRPGRVATVPKTVSAIEQILGTREGEREVIPHWMQQSMHVRLKGEGEGNNALYWLPALPLEDVSRFISGSTKENVADLLSNITPMAKIPIEQAYGRRLYGGQAPIRSQTEYFAGQLPPARMLYNMIKSAPEGQEEGRVGGRRVTVDQLRNYLLATGLQDISPGEQLSELRRQQDAIQFKLNAAKREKRKKAYGT